MKAKHNILRITGTLAVQTDSEQLAKTTVTETIATKQTNKKQKNPASPDVEFNMRKLPKIEQKGQ